MTRIRASRPDEAARLFEIWHEAVAATHDFLAPEDFESIAAVVREEYLPRHEFWVVTDGDDRALGFLGMTGAKVDSLFIDPSHCRQGFGTALMTHARTRSGDLDVDVNEQNEAAVAFYGGLGFRQVGRSACDDSGRPYPLLHMKLETVQSASARR